jgi:hypothetical protein
LDKRPIINLSTIYTTFPTNVVMSITAETIFQGSQLPWTICFPPSSRSLVKMRKQWVWYEGLGRFRFESENLIGTVGILFSAIVAPDTKGTIETWARQHRIRLRKQNLVA